MKRTDPAHKWTDEEIERIEKEISKEYKQAHEEAVKKTKAYFKDFERKDEKWRELVEAGKVTEKEYLTWRKGQMLVGKRWEGLCETLAEDYLNAAEIAMSICKEHAPEVYAVNHNYTTFECEQGSGMDTSYTLYSRETVERMYREDPKLYHDYGKAVAKDIKEGRQIAWDKKRVKSVLTQAVLQGESIPKIAKRLEIITGGDHKAAIRNARTMMTGVQNAGRIDAMKRANDLGIPTKKQWLATVDNRTRHWHRELDGVIKDIDEPFENSMGKIMFPADPEAAGANVYNCRCTLLSAIEGFELDVTDPSVRPMPKLGDMSYEEWRGLKEETSKDITALADRPKVTTQIKGVPKKYDARKEWVETTLGVSEADATKIIDTVRAYTSEGDVYAKVHNMDASYMDEIKTLDSLIKNPKMPVFDGAIYRGIHVSDSDGMTAVEKIETILQTGTWREAGITSFSNNRAKANMFAEGGAHGSKTEGLNVLIINKNNKTGVPIQHLTSQRPEGEVLVPSDIAERGYKILKYRFRDKHEVWLGKTFDSKWCIIEVEENI